MNNEVTQIAQKQSTSAIEIIGNTQTIYGIVAFVITACIFLVVLFNFRSKINRTTQKQIDVFVNNGKPVGLVSKEKMLTVQDTKYIKFIKLATGRKYKYKIGFDSCQTPAILNFCPDVAKESLEFCEAARFSMYIDCDLKAYPCSFGHSFNNYSIDLTKTSVENAWNSNEFELFRKNQKDICNDCSQINCRNCAFDLGINVCGKIHKNKS